MSKTYLLMLDMVHYTKETTSANVTSDVNDDQKEEYKLNIHSNIFRI